MIRPNGMKSDGQFAFRLKSLFDFVLKVANFSIGSDASTQWKQVVFVFSLENELLTVNVNYLFDEITMRRTMEFVERFRHHSSSPFAPW